MLKKFFSIAALAFVFMCGIKAEAQDIWVGTSPSTGWECYIMTETIRHWGETDINLATLKMVANDDSVRQIEYRFWWDFRIDAPCFSIKFFARNLPTLVGRGIAILILYIFLYSFFAHIAKSSHIITV